MPVVSTPLRSLRLRLGRLRRTPRRSSRPRPARSSLPRLLRRVGKTLPRSPVARLLRSSTPSCWTLSSTARWKRRSPRPDWAALCGGSIRAVNRSALCRQWVLPTWCWPSPWTTRELMYRPHRMCRVHVPRPTLSHAPPRAVKPRRKSHGLRRVIVRRTPPCSWSTSPVWWTESSSRVVKPSSTSRSPVAEDGCIVRRLRRRGRGCGRHSTLRPRRVVRFRRSRWPGASSSRCRAVPTARRVLQQLSRRAWMSHTMAPCWERSSAMRAATSPSVVGSPNGPSPHRTRRARRRWRHVVTRVPLVWPTTASCLSRQRWSPRGWWTTVRSAVRTPEA